MRVGILGPTEVRGPDGAALDVPGPRARALLAILALDAGRVVGTARLIDGLYGAAVPGNAANALQSQVSRLRQALRAGGLPDVVEFHPGGYRLAIDQEDVDAHRFARLTRAGRAALDDGDPARARAVLRDADALWRGPALADAPLADGAARFEELRLDAAEDHVEARLRDGEHGDLLAELRALVARHPFRERLRGQLVRALHGAGRTPEALAAFEDARRLLAEELGIDPSPELAAAHLAVLRRPVPAAPHSRLPAQLTTFVGRAGECERVEGLLEHTRLVTLTGPGGAGKTRLAIEAAAAHSRETALVELAPVRDPADVPQAALAALGLREAALPRPGQEHPATPPAERLVTALAGRPMLLLLDNCEHVVDAAAGLADTLLAACPALRVLATSREPLGITGEVLLPVPRLAIAPAGTPPARAMDYPAVRLFADRAAAGRPGFAVDDETGGDVLRICEALDGMPLAIELAAARVRSLPVGEIAARLDDRFSLLSKGSRTASSRHRTLRAVVEWSWDLLDHRERELARRLTVFAGGATLAAAEQVCGLPDGVDELTGLADKSLVENTAGRYRMLQTVHAFCAERLDEAGETAALRRAHAEHFGALAETASPHLVRTEQLDWLARLDPEHDNLHAALRWAITADVRLALRLVSALTPYWWLRGRRSEGSTLAAELAERIGVEPPSGMGQEYALCVLNAVFDPPRSVALHSQLDRARQILDSLATPPRQPFLMVLHAVAFGPPADDSALRSRTETLLGSDPWTAALEPMGAGLYKAYRGNVHEGHELLARSLGLFRELGERWGLSMVLGGLGQLHAWRGQTERGRELIDEAIDLTRQLGAAQDTADLLAQRAEASLLGGDPAGARADYERSAELARHAGSLDKAAVAELGLAELAWRDGDPDAARRLVDHVQTSGGTSLFELEATRLRGLTLLGRIAATEGRAADALALYRQALDLPSSGISWQTSARTVEAMGGLAFETGAPAQAARCLGAAAELRGAGIPAPAGSAELAAALRRELGDDRYEREHEAGAKLTLDELTDPARWCGGH